MNTTTIVSPRELGLPHDEWRPGQLDAIKWILAKEGFKILSAPTGAGKTSTARAIASDKRVIALCRTKNLQEVNYSQTYNFDSIFGKNNYDCVHPSYGGTADACAYADSGMSKCGYASQCPYLVAKAIAQESRAASMNYAYWLSARWPQQSRPEVLVLDEAHQLPDITLDWAGIEISERTRSEWNLNDFPRVSPRDGDGFIITTEKPIKKIIEWLEKARPFLATQHERLLKSARTNEEIRKKANRCESLIRKIDATLGSIRLHPDDWYTFAGLEDGKPKLICKPLSAKYHFKSFFNHSNTVVMMSATIGSPEAFSGELGLEEYDYHRVENQWPPETRPVYDLGAPRMSHNSTPNDYNAQADVIAAAIHECPSDWSGVIHVTRKAEANLLLSRLGARGLSKRVWMPSPTDGTNMQMRAWERERQRYPGRLAVTWTWWEGVDLTEERICIVCKTPFPYLGSPYEVARQRHSQKTYLWRTAVQIEQALGRTRRGDASDYDLNGKREQLVAIADGNWRRVQSYLSPDLREAIKKI